MAIANEPTAMKRLTVMLHSHDHTHHHSLAIEILARAKRAHLAGATLLRGREGQGRSGTLHRQHTFVEDVPLSVVIVDSPEKIETFVNEINDLVSPALVVIDDVTAFRA